MLDIELLRLDLERELVARMRASEQLGPAASLDPRPSGPPDPRRPPGTDPRIFSGAAQHVRQALQLEIPVEVWVTAVQELRLHAGRRSFTVEIPSTTADAITRAEASALFGWHLGHHLAHTAHPAYAPGAEASRHAARRTIPYAYGVVSRMTADRFALLSSDLPSTLALIAGALGDEGFDANAWLRASQHDVDRLRDDRGVDWEDLEPALRACAVTLPLDQANGLARAVISAPPA